MSEIIESYSPMTGDMGADDEFVVQCYCSWHRKLMQTGPLFDPSWESEPSRLQDRLRWASRLFQVGEGVGVRAPLFSHVIERLILLTPAELQRLLCALSLLARRLDLRRCIDGAAVRKLQEVVGTDTLAAVLRSRRSQSEIGLSSADLSVHILLAQANAWLAGAYAAEWPVVLQCLRLALPSDLPAMPYGETRDDVLQLLREAHAWFPETTWLFG